MTNDEFAVETCAVDPDFVIRHSSFVIEFPRAPLTLIPPPPTLQPMSVASIPDFLIPPEEYLAGEELSAEKHEYLNSLVYAMAGDSPAHSAVSANIIT